MSESTLRRITLQEQGRSTELFAEGDERLLALLGTCVERDFSRITIVSCTCGTTCCQMHKTHTSPHMGCILR